MDFSSPTFDATHHRLRDRFGARTDLWWERLPGIFVELAERWDLVLDDAVGRGNTSVVVRCRVPDGRRAVLKLTVDAQIGAAEALALRSLESSGRVPLVWGHDAALGALLLEAIPSEAPLSEIGMAVEVGEVADLIDRLHHSVAPVTADGLESLAERVDFIFEYWVERHSRCSNAVIRTVPVDRLCRGHELAQSLLADAGVPVLLHGDLHPGNVLDGGAARGLVAIDPRPCVGDAAFDAIDWVFWAVNDPNAWELRSRDLALAVGVEPARLWAWCAAFAAMLAASRAARGAGADEVAALLALAP